MRDSERHFDPRSCQHEATRLVFRPDKNGNPRYQHQCVSCGAARGNWIPVQTALKLQPQSEIPPFDSALQSRMEKRAVELNALKRHQRRGWYREYLRSDAWREKSDLVRKRAGGICEGCRAAPVADVHHLSYLNAGREFLWELVAVCRPCHERAHALNPPPQWLDAETTSDADEFDARIERDAESGALDEIAEKAVREDQSGDAREL